MAEDLTPKYDERGLVPAIVQDIDTGKVLMLAWMNAEAFRLTLETRQATFWSRSRQELWRKGATSGNVMHVVEVRIDCDQDALLVLARPTGPACHTGNESCFFRVIGDFNAEGAETAEKSKREAREKQEKREKDELTSEET